MAAVPPTPLQIRTRHSSPCIECRGLLARKGENQDMNVHDFSLLSIEQHQIRSSGTKPNKRSALSIV